MSQQTSLFHDIERQERLEEQQIQQELNRLLHDVLKEAFTGHRPPLTPEEFAGWAKQVADTLQLEEGFVEQAVEAYLQYLLSQELAGSFSESIERVFGRSDASSAYQSSLFMRFRRLSPA